MTIGGGLVGFWVKDTGLSAALWAAGFVIEQIVEPKPTERCRQVYPEHYKRLSKHPVFLCMRAKKDEERKSHVPS